MSINRNAYLLTTNKTSDRTRFSYDILKQIGFNVILIDCIPDSKKVLSNKISMQYIYELISNSNDEWSYVFEDDINILRPITLSEIIEYENISNKVFYLGLCKNIKKLNRNIILTDKIIQENKVYVTNGSCRGLHAIGLSKSGSKELLEYSRAHNHKKYMDMILEMFVKKNPANIVCYELESYIKGHRGVIFQDRKKFPSSI